MSKCSISSINDSLTEYEKTEILEYKDIYYIGKKENKLKITNDDYKQNNNIFTRNNKFILSENDHIGFRHNILEIIGKGTYGSVVKTKDYKRHIYRAIKIFNYLENVPMEQVNKIFLYELDVLNILTSRHANYLKKELFTFYSYSDVFRNHNYIVFKLYGYNLYQSRNRLKTMHINNKLIIIKDIFLALYFLSCDTPKIIHGDIKPENILFRTENINNFNIVLCDFGLSIKLESEYIKTNNIIQTRWYRAPELIYNIPFNEKIDIWSAGTVVYELIFNKPLFKCKIDNDLLIYIHYILGCPSHEFIHKHPNIKYFYNDDLKPKYTINFYEDILHPNMGKNILDKHLDYDVNNINHKIRYHLIRLIYKCLEYNSDSRISTKNSIKFLNKYCLEFM